MKLTKFLTAILFTLYCATSFGQFATNSFADKIDFSTASNPQGMTLSDLNNDGKLDILSANIGGATIGIYINTSLPGGFNYSSLSNIFTLTTLSNLPQQIVTGDLNNDGKLDLVVGYSTSNLFSVFLNNYSGGTMSASSFSRIDFTAANTPSGVGVGDFDGDGKLDIAVTNYGSNLLYVYRNTTVSSFSLSSANSYSTGSAPNSLVVGNIDSDGKPDIALTNYSSGTISVYRNISTSIGSIAFSSTSVSSQTNPYWIRMANLDTSSNLEIICSNYSSQSASIFRNTLTNGISFAPRIDLSISPNLYTQASALADFDADRNIDIAVTTAGSNIFCLFKNNFLSAPLTWASFSSYTTFPTGNGPVGAVAGDLDNDFRPDLIVSNYNSQTFSVFKNRILANEPTIPASNITTIPSTGSVTLNFTKGNGNRRLIVARTSSNSMVSPVDTSFYTANSIFGNGTNIGSNNFIVYGDTGSNVTITGLAFGQVYNFTIYEYNGIGGYSNYLTSSAVAITQNMGDMYYSKSSGALNLLSSWGPNTDGSGTTPTTFYNPNTVFIVVNNPAPTLTANWIVSGTNSFVIIGDGINALNFTIPSGSSLFSDSVAIKANATLTFIGGLIGNKAFFDSLSTAQFTSSSAQNIPGFTYYNLVVANSIKTITNNCTVKGSLNLLNNINTGSYTITLGTSGSQPGVLNRNANGTITGRFKRWFTAATNTGSSGLFPMLVGTNYRPASVEFATAPTTAGTLTTEFFSIPPGNSGLYLYDFSLGFVEVNKAATNGYWKIDALGSTGGIYTLTLTGTGFYGISAVTDLRIIKRQTAGAWTLPSGSSAIAGTGSTTAPVVGRSGYSGFGEFTLGGDSTQNPMPVKWLSFEGFRNDDGVVLNWETAQEINNAHFIVERKIKNQKHFESIEKVNPEKFGVIKFYTFTDKTNDFKGISFYRIKQIDFDGTTSISKEIAINPEIIEINKSVYPNPAYEYLYLDMKNDSKIELISIDGKVFPIESINGKIDVSAFDRGIYFLRLIENNNNYLFKVILK